MREIRLSGSEGGAAQTNASSLPPIQPGVVMDIRAGIFGWPNIRKCGINRRPLRFGPGGMIAVSRVWTVFLFTP